MPYSRPKRLSDPHKDWPGHMRARFIKTPDDKLTGKDFIDILGPYLPAANYAEGAYFLAHAMRRYVQEVPDEVGDGTFAKALVGFIDENAERFDRDRLMAPCRACFAAILNDWTSSFELVDEGRPEHAFVARGWLVVDLVRELTASDWSAPWARQWTEELGKDPADHRQAWYFYLRSELTKPTSA